MKFVSSLVVLGSLASSVTAAACNADNCLRGLRATARIDEAREFCGTFTSATVTATEGLPTYAAAACTGDVVSRISSACSCIAVSTTTPVATPTPTACDPNASYPVLPLPSGAFDLVGYGKENPIGPVIGGEGGPTTTINAASTGANAALILAATGSASLNIVLEGEFKLPIRLRVGNNKSIIGSSTGGTISSNGTIGSGGITIINAVNVIVRNLKINGVPNNDCITIQNATRIWIDHNDMSSDPNIIKNGPDLYDGLLDIVRGSDWITVSWNYLHDHYKASLIGNNPAFRDIDYGHFHISYHHNYFKNLGTRGPAGRFGSQHIYNNYYKDFRYQAIHSRSDNQVLVEGNVFTGDTREALSTYGLVIMEDSPNTSPLGDYELDGFANLGATNDFGGSGVNITQTGNFTSVPYAYTLTPLADVPAIVVRYTGINKI